MRATIDSRGIEPGDLFVGLPGERVDGATFAPDALRAGAWGALVGRAAAADAVPPGALLVADDPLMALQRLASTWRAELGAQVIAITGSTGKTSTKDIVAALVRPHRRTVASPANFNTEVGLPLAVLAAPPGTEVLVLELAMRGPGQIAELTAIADPDVGVIVNVGPVHLELLGSLEAVAAAKAELLRDMRSGGTAVVPASEPLLDRHRPAHLRVVTFGEGGDVRLVDADGGDVRIDAGGTPVELGVPFTQAHNRLNLLAAVAAACTVGVTPAGRVDVALSQWRGERIDLPDGIAVINDCYNANPMSMRAALDDLAVAARARRVAVLGDMLELGARDEQRFHRQAGSHAAEQGVDVLVTVGPLAAEMAKAFPREAHSVADASAAAELVAGLLEPGDTVLVKGSRGVGLEVVAERLARSGPADEARSGPRATARSGADSAGRRSPRAPAR
jgi:UDP-N-acetylmuramoyl-tripeptide--D-alanyl-D-alanine ligase